MDSSLRPTRAGAGLLLGGHSVLTPLQPFLAGGCSCILEVKGTRCVQSKHVAFSPSCTWLGVSQSTCLRCSQIAMESRSSSTQVAPEVTSPFPRGLVAAACSAVALPEIVGGWEEVTLHQVPLDPASHCQPPAFHSFLVI